MAKSLLTINMLHNPKLNSFKVKEQSNCTFNHNLLFNELHFLATWNSTENLRISIYKQLVRREKP